MTVYRWVIRFNEGMEDLKDFDRPGRPITAVTPSKIYAVHRLIQEDIHISYDRIVAQLSLSKCSIHEIIHGHLKMRKITSRWVPYVLNDAQKKKRDKFCKENLERFNSGKWRICDIITADESLIYYRAIGHIISNQTWLG